MKKKAHRSCPVSPCFAVVVARFHEPIAESLLKACLSEFARQGICDCDVQVIYVPGAFEIPVTVLKLAQKTNIQAVIGLGAVIKGQTLHYELVAQQVARGMMDVAIKTGKPVVFEILAADTVKLCQARSKSGDRDNKGASAARVAVEMVKTLSDI